MEQEGDHQDQWAFNNHQQVPLGRRHQAGQDLQGQDLRVQDLRVQDLRCQDLRAQNLRGQDLPGRPQQNQDQSQFHPSLTTTRMNLTMNMILMNTKKPAKAQQIIQKKSTTMQAASKELEMDSG